MQKQKLSRIYCIFFEQVMKFTDASCIFDCGAYVLKITCIKWIHILNFNKFKK